MPKKIFVFLFDGYSDWEIAYLTPEIHKSDDFELIYFSKDGGAVQSMGGLQVQTQIALSDIAISEVEMLVLPGGTAWEKGLNTELEPLIKAQFAAGRDIAAICAATTFLGQQGLLDNLQHTSNALSYLQAIAPSYSGAAYYQNALAVSARNVITANGIAPIEFAREVFNRLELYSPEDSEKWFQLFKNGVWSE